MWGPREGQRGREGGRREGTRRRKKNKGRRFIDYD
jgi:hypothetical protein